MERYFILDKFNTYYDWRLVLTAKSVTPPEPKTNYIELDGANGTLDLTEALRGEVAYTDRTVTASFWTNEGTYSDRVNLLRDIITALHGRKVKITEPDDPYHYFYGRVTVKSVKNTLAYLEFTLEAICEPWRYALEDTVRRVDISSTSIDVVINNRGVKSILPTIFVSNSAEITYNGIKTNLTTGSYRISNIRLPYGFSVISVKGSGYIEVSYKEATL